MDQGPDLARLKQIALKAYDPIAGLVLEEGIVDGRITKVPRRQRVRWP
jgi:hypothetical protein